MAEEPSRYRATGTLRRDSRVGGLGPVIESYTRSAADLWRNALAPIPTLFGRLTFLAGLLDPATDRYEHSSLSIALGRDETDQTLRRAHHLVFGQWLAMSLEEQMSDLGEFLASREPSLGPLHYRDLPPKGAHEVERQLYLTDLETLLELLDAARGASLETEEA